MRFTYYCSSATIGLRDSVHSQFNISSGNSFDQGKYLLSSFSLVIFSICGKLSNKYFIYLYTLILFTFADSISEYITAFAFAPSILSANSQFFLCTANGLIALSAKLFDKGILASLKNSLSSFL